MKTLSPDTHPDAERVLIEGYRRMSAAEKLAIVQRLGRTVRHLQMQETRRRHPGADEREVALRVASRRLGPDLMRRAFGWDPDTRGY